MIKKLFSFIFCLMPIGAMAAPQTITPSDGDASFTVNGGITVDADTESKIIGSNTDTGADGTNPAETVARTLTITGGGIDIINDFIVGHYTGTTNGGLFLLGTDTSDTYKPYNTTAGTTGFTITSAGPITIGGMLQVESGNTLTLGQTGTATTNMTVGSIDNLGKLALTKINTFTTTGAIRNDTGAMSFDIDAVSMSTKSIANTSGTMTIGHRDSSNNIVMTGGLNTNGGTIISSGTASATNITAGSITSSSIQNGSGTMDIELSGNLVSSGVIENKSGQAMNITAADITATGAMTNEGGNMVISAANLTVNGQDATHNNASFVNSGNLTINVTGATKLANGFDISAMAITNNFSLTTGTLNAGSGNWLQLFANKLNSFNVNVKNGDLIMATTDIINGQSDGTTNANANMTVTAQSVSANSVTNSAKNLNITATTDAVTIANGVTTTAGATDITNGVTTTNIIAKTTVTTGAVTNDSMTTINGTTGTTVASITNNANGTLKVLSGTNSSGIVKVGTTSTSGTFVPGTVSNSGTLDIQARQITMGNLTNTAGTTTIKGSDNNGDALTVGTVTASGGVIKIDALAGDITANGDLLVQKNTNGGGSLNIGKSTKSLTTTGTINIGGDVTLSSNETTNAGSVNIGAEGVQNFVLTSGTGLTIGGKIEAIQSDVVRTAQFIANNNIINIGGEVTATGLGHLIFGNAAANVTTIAGNVTANKDASNKSGTIEFYGNETSVGSLSGDGKIIAHGEQIKATDGDINIGNNTIWFNNPTSDPASGLIVRGTSTLTLTTRPSGGDITVGGIELASGNTLNLTSAHDITMSGLTTDNGTLNVTAANLAKIVNDITVATTGSVKIDASTINMSDLTNNNSATLIANNITADKLDAQAGTMNITAAQDLSASVLEIASGAKVNLAADNATFTGPVIVNGDIVQGSNQSVGALNIIKNGTTFTADSLSTENGDFIANGYTGTYNITDDVTIDGDITVNSGTLYLSSANGKIAADNVTNKGTLTLFGANGIDISSGAITSSGNLTLNSGTEYAKASSANLTGTTTLMGLGLDLAGTLTQNMLRQNYTGTLAARDINIMANNYTIWTTGATFNGIAQESGYLTINTSDLNVTQTNVSNGNINATNLTVAANPSAYPDATTNPKWLTVNVGGSIFGNTKFIGLQHMTIGGNYIYDSNSGLVMVVLPATDAGRDYWADVSLKNDDTLGQITNRSPDAEPLISVNGKLITQLDNVMDPSTGLLSGGKMGVKIFDMIDPGTAIWLLKADMGIVEEGTKIRNLLVQYCNADGTECFTYLKTKDTANKTDEELPAYISVRDTTSDGVADSLYLVFDPRFGGPVEIFKLQPIVERQSDHTTGEYITAGALDDMIAGQLETLKFYNRTPIEAIPFIFRDTNMSEMANQLYNRMEYYEQTRDGTALARFSRLFQPREIEQLAGSIVLNEHTSFRDFEDHMLDEFIWNRNRNLRKAWGEFDFGIFNQKGSDDLKIDGNRFSFTGGYDWQETNTLILGLAGRISHMSGNNSDNIELGYKPGQPIAGSVDVDVADTNFGIGAYLLQTLGTKMRVYGNAFLDMHWLEVTRKQTYMSSIEGDGTSFSLISEWGLMHDWLNQYVVGNLYARVGYNFGFSVTEKAEGDDYMKLESDGYFIVTPGYSLIAQKRIYPSPWFQIRPYASVGVEYDVLGAPDTAKFKFAAAKSFTEYDIEIDPLWANIGGGVELLSATGVQVGLDYRYQYNSDIQMHKIKLSGSYRF